jgi:general secretion pathway protein G
MVKPQKAQSDRRQEEGGFTLIEVLIVTVVLGIIVAIVLVSLLNAFEKSKQRATMADMRTISKALEAYQIDHGAYPVGGSTITDLKNLLIPYQTNVVPVKDHWNHDYIYMSDGLNNYSVESYGKDGIDGPADITYATRWQFNRDIIVSNGIFTASPED